MVDNAAQVLLAWISMDSPAELAERTLRNGQIAAADLLILNADILSTDVLVVADRGKALGKHDDGVSLDDEPDSGVLGISIMIFSIVLVGHTGRAEVDDLDLVEDLGALDIDL
jgi:hypothetical protein